MEYLFANLDYVTTKKESETTVLVVAELIDEDRIDRLVGDERVGGATKIQFPSSTSKITILDGMRWRPGCGRKLNENIRTYKALGVESFLVCR